ncbi:MAG: GNAT family N-acetyltransferase [Candidatus Rokubacteria bacterium]|nr:GNAT family N-acetyltransferase [Candidatus Rokubacteria bacterium]
MTEARVECLAAGAVAADAARLVALLQDAVESGASIGFLPPLGAAEAAAYWESVAAAIDAGTRVLLVARTRPGEIAGSVQLDLATRANGRHRAEVVRLMVLRRWRRHGLGRALMLATETAARQQGRSTLVLDTRAGDPAEALYRALGWTAAGTIPRFAQSADGSLHATAIYYKLLDPPG